MRAATSRPVCAAAAAAEADDGLDSSSPSEPATAPEDVAAAAVGDTSGSRSRSRLVIGISTDGLASPMDSSPLLPFLVAAAAAVAGVFCSGLRVCFAVPCRPRYFA